MSARERITKACAFAALALSTAHAQEEEDIRGPKPLVDVPVSDAPAPWWLWLLVAVFVIVVAGLVKWLIRRKKPTPSVESIARKQIERLRRDGDLLDATTFAESASGVLRNFIEGRFGLAASKRTTEEFLHELSDSGHALAGRRDVLRDFLRACDQAKFAGGDLVPEQREDLLDKASAFINEPPIKEVGK